MWNSHHHQHASQRDVYLNTIRSQCFPFHTTFMPDTNYLQFTGLPDWQLQIFSSYHMKLKEILRYHPELLPTIIGLNNNNLTNFLMHANPGLVSSNCQALLTSYQQPTVVIVPPGPPQPVVVVHEASSPFGYSPPVSIPGPRFPNSGYQVPHPVFGPPGARLPHGDHHHHQHGEGFSPGAGGFGPRPGQHGHR